MPLFFHFRRDLEREAQEQRVRQWRAEEKEHSLRILSLEELLKSMREQLEDSVEQNKELEAEFLSSLRYIGNHRRKLLALKTEQDREDIRSQGANLIFDDVPMAMKESECEELKTLLLTPEGRRVFAFQLNSAVSDSIGESNLSPIAFSQLSDILKYFFASCNHMSDSDTEAVRTDSARAKKARRKLFLLVLYSACVHIDALVSHSNSHTRNTQVHLTLQTCRRLYVIQEPAAAVTNSSAQVMSDFSVVAVTKAGTSAVAVTNASAVAVTACKFMRGHEVSECFYTDNSILSPFHH